MDRLPPRKLAYPHRQRWQHGYPLLPAPGRPRVLRRAPPLSPLTERARALVQPILDALDPRVAVRDHLAGAAPERYLLIAIGKAAPAMARGAIDAWGEPVDALVLCSDGCDDLGLDVLRASHPVPDGRGVAATERILHRVQTARVPVLFLISGGGSALLVAPRPPDTLESIAAATDSMLREGLSIGEINAWRSGHSRVKGGGLGRACAAPFRTLVIRDLDGPLEWVASGPTAGSPLEEVLGPDHAVRAAAAATGLGYTVQIGPFATGEARRLGSTLLEALPPGVAFIRPAEPTVTVRGAGRGGRSQELALAAAIHYAGRPGWALLALGTDGVDGPTDAAGAVVDGSTWGPGAQQALDDNDAYPWLDSRGALVRTGPTGTNVADIHVVLTESGPL